MLVRRLTIQIAAVLAGLLAVGPVHAVEPQWGNVNGLVEDPLITRLIDCMDMEDDARELFYFVPARDRPDAVHAAAIQAQMLAAAKCLGDLVTDLKALRDLPGMQASTRLADAIDFARNAQFRDVEAADMALHKAKAGRIRSRIDQADRWKARACLALQGFVTKDKDAVRAAADLRDRLALTRAAFLATFSGALSPVSLWLVERHFARLYTLRHPQARKSGGPTDRYLGFRATKDATGAYGFASLQRDLRGPYEARVTIGAFTASTSRKAALGTAFGCMELDVKGSSPLVFLSVCARPTSTGVQAFATSSDGQQGSTFLTGAERVVLKTTYDGTTFTCSAKPDTADDSAFVQFATWTRAQGADVWVAGFGAAQLSGKAEIGIDDAAIYAIAR